MPEDQAETHQLVNFMRQVHGELQLEYERISREARADPGTAGDEGEGNWAEILKDWLPSTYHVVTKGRILTALGEASPQVDVVVLKPNYPVKLLEKKYYLSSGVLAAFECKNTLRRDGLEKAISNSKAIADMLVRERSEGAGYWRDQKPSDPVYSELHKPMIYGLLAHSHNWADQTARDNVTRVLDESQATPATHPRDLLDLICIADLAVWSAGRCTVSIARPPRPSGSFLLPSCHTTFSCLHPEQWQEGTIYAKSFTVIGVLLSRLYERLSHLDSDAALHADYFKLATKDGRSGGGACRLWGELLSPGSRALVGLDMNGYW